MKFFSMCAGALAALSVAGAVVASPLPYINAPMDTPQGLVNQGIANINGAFPEAQVNQNATAVSGAVTVNGIRATVTSESLTTAAAGFYTLTVTNSSIAANSQLVCFVGLGTSTTGVPDCTSVTLSAGSAVFQIQNTAASAAFNGTIKVGFMVYN